MILKREVSFRVVGESGKFAGVGQGEESAVDRAYCITDIMQKESY
jgi:hypothetical protein